MPAGSDGPGRSPALPSLPHTFRPLGVRIAALVLGGLLVGTTVAIWYAFPSDVRAQFTTFQRTTVIVLGLMLGAAGYALGRCRMVARDDGLLVVNGYRRRHYEWAQVLAVRLSTGHPWAVLDLSDGTSQSVLAIQGSDGARAQRALRQLRALIEEKTRTEHDR